MHLQNAIHWIPVQTNILCCHFIFFVYRFFNLKSNTPLYLPHPLHTKTKIIILFWFEYSQFTHYFGLRVGWQFIFQNTVRRLWWLTSATTDSAFNSFRGSYFHWVRTSCFVAFNLKYWLIALAASTVTFRKQKQQIWSINGFFKCLFVVSLSAKQIFVYNTFRNFLMFEWSVCSVFFFSKQKF